MSPYVYLGRKDNALEKVFTLIKFSFIKVQKSTNSKEKRLINLTIVMYYKIEYSHSPWSDMYIRIHVEEYS